MSPEPADQQQIKALQRGVTAARAGLHMAATSAFERAAELMPDSPEVWNWLAWTANSPDTALRCLRRALELNPQDHAAAAGVQWLSRLAGNVIQPSEPAVRLGDAAHPNATVPEMQANIPDLVRVSTAVSESLPEATLSLDVIAPADRGSVFQAEALGWATPPDVASAPSPRTVGQTPLLIPTFPAVVIPPPESESDESVNSLATKIAEAVVSKVEADEKLNEPVVRANKPLPPAFVPAQSRKPVVDPYADDDPRRFSELVRQASLMPLPSLPPATEPASIVASRFSEPPSASRLGDQTLEEPVDLDALTRAFRPALFDSANDGRPVVMVVDDSPTVRKLVSLTLERRGFRVVAADDGVTAIHELGSCRPDLILLDITMPRLDGYRLCKLIKKHEVTQHIPVVMLSGKDGLFDKLRGRLVGCSDYITKPFEADALTQKVSKYMTLNQTNISARGRS